MRYIMACLTLLSFAAYGQSASDTMFFDQSWNKCTRDTFTYRRLIQKRNDLFYVKDYYNNDTLRMSGSFTSLSPDIKNGYFTYYFRSGHLRMEGDYYNAKRRGAFKTYDDSTGMVLFSEQYKNDQKHGRNIAVTKNGIKTTSIFENGQLLRFTISMVSMGKKTDTFVIDSNALNGYYDYGKLFNELLRRNLEQKLPDSLLFVISHVQLQFMMDSNGVAKHIIVVQNEYDKLLEIVKQTLWEMPRWHMPDTIRKVADTFNCNLYIQFPRSVTELNMYPRTAAESRTFYKEENDLAFLFENFIKKGSQNILITNDFERSRTITVRFELSRKGILENVAYQRYDNAKAAIFIKEMIQSYAHWPVNIVNGKSQKTEILVTVSFPKMEVRCYSRLRE